MDKPTSAEELNIPVALGEEFSYEDKPQYTFDFGDFLLTYSGYLPSAHQLYGFGPSFAGRHYFSVMLKERIDNKRVIKALSWSSGTGELVPLDFTLGEKRYTFYPFAPARIELFNPDNKI
jgi:hypothetical protein